MRPLRRSFGFSRPLSAMILKAAIVANCLAMLTSLLLQLCISCCGCGRAIPAASPAGLPLEASYRAAGIRTLIARRLLLHLPHDRTHPQLQQSAPNFRAFMEYLPHSRRNVADPSMFSRGSSSSYSSDHQQEKDLQQGFQAGPSADILGRNSQNADDEEKRFVPAGPNPLHNR